MKWETLDFGKLRIPSDNEIGGGVGAKVQQSTVVDVYTGEQK